jgi:hypothetical protein
MNVRDVRGIAAFALAAALATAGCAHSGETPAWKTLPKPAALPMPDESGLAPGNVCSSTTAIFDLPGGSPVAGRTRARRIRQR